MSSAPESRTRCWVRCWERFSAAGSGSAFRTCSASSGIGIRHNEDVKAAAILLLIPAIACGVSRETFSGSIAPILFAKCAGCHRDGGVGPFPLLTYTDAAKRASLIAQVTKV